MGLKINANVNAVKVFTVSNELPIWLIGETLSHWIYTQDAAPVGTNTAICGNSNNDGFVAMIDNAGDALWAKRFPDLTWFQQVVADGEGGIIVSGEFNSAPLLCRFDATGTPIWTKTFSTGRSFSRLISTSDGHFIGTTSDASLIVKFDLDGNIPWSRRANGTLRSIREVSDGFLLSGDQYVSSTLSYAHLIRLNLNGEKVWWKRLTTTYHPTIHDIVQTQDGTILAVMEYRNSSTNRRPGLLACEDRADAAGFLWAKYADFSGQFYAAAIDGNDVYATGFSDAEDAMLVRLDPQGTIGYWKTYPGWGGRYSRSLDLYRNRLYLSSYSTEPALLARIGLDGDMGDFDVDRTVSFSNISNTLSLQGTAVNEYTVTSSDVESTIADMALPTEHLI